MRRTQARLRVGPSEGRMLLVLAAAMAAALAGARPALAIRAKAAAPEAVRVEDPSAWFEAAYSESAVTRDGRRLFSTLRGRGRVQSLGASTEDEARPFGGVEQVSSATAFARDGFVVRGVRRGELSWYIVDGKDPRRVDLPQDALPRWDSTGMRVAFVRRGEGASVLHVRGAGTDLERRLGGPARGLTWSDDGRLIFVAVQGTDGATSLVAYTVEGERRTIAEGLDATPFFSSIAYAASPPRVIMALASGARPVAAARHEPLAPRDLDLYAIDVERGVVRLVIDDPGDDFSPTVGGGHLYWTRNEVVQQVVGVPIRGGPARRLADDAQLPRWDPAGSRLAFTVGPWRLADMALNLDAFVAGVEADGTLGPAEPLVAGYHEDFTPAWSPDGRWLAYHSHRSREPVHYYSADGSTDDVYLRRAASSVGVEVRLTDFGSEVGAADWSADSRQLGFVSHERGTAEAPAVPWVLTIDRESGRVLETRRLPLPEGAKSAESLAFAPAGEELAILAAGEDGRKGVWLQESPGGGARRIASFEATTFGGLDWMPSGEGIVFSALAGARMGLWAVDRNPAGWGAARLIASEPEADLLHPQVSPDGKTIAASRVHWRKSLLRLPLPEAAGRSSRAVPLPHRPASAAHVPFRAAR